MNASVTLDELDRARDFYLEMLARAFASHGRCLTLSVVVGTDEHGKPWQEPCSILVYQSRADFDAVTGARASGEASARP